MRPFRHIAIAAVLAACIALGLSSAQAAITQNEAGWHCGTLDEWEAATITPAKDLTLNNFYFSYDREEQKPHGIRMKTLEVEFSATNRGPKTYRFSGQFAGFNKDGELTFALSAAPVYRPSELVISLFDTTLYRPVDPGTETARGKVFVKKNFLRKTSQVCVLFVAER